MPRTLPDIDAVTQLLEAVGRDVILPRFRRLEASDVLRKVTPGYPEDLVTVVDRDAEAHLTRGLRALWPGAAVLGEEVAHSQPGLLALVHGDDPVWIVDPIDGTRNFARGDDRFGIMVSFVERGAARAAWVVLPAQGHTFVAEAGSGASMDGQPLRVPSREADAPTRGTLSIRFMPDALRDEVSRKVHGRFEAGPFSGASAIDYTTIMQGGNEFLVYYRLLPWDHAAPALILTEAGGLVEHADGRPYTARSSSQVTIVGRDAAVTARVRAWLSPPSP